MATDLVEYVVVSFPDREALRSVVPALTEMVRAERIRVLDIVVLVRAPDGLLDLLEIGDVDALTPLGEIEGDLGLLSENDLRLAARAVPPGEAGLILVAEDRWAEQLSLAAHRVGGRVVAGERIPSLRVEAALDERPDDDDRGA